MNLLWGVVKNHIPSDIYPFLPNKLTRTISGVLFDCSFGRGVDLQEFIYFHTPRKTIRKARYVVDYKERERIIDGAKMGRALLADWQASYMPSAVHGELEETNEESYVGHTIFIFPSANGRQTTKLFSLFYQRQRIEKSLKKKFPLDYLVSDRYSPRLLDVSIEKPFAEKEPDILGKKSDKAGTWGKKWIEMDTSPDYIYFDFEIEYRPGE